MDALFFIIPAIIVLVIIIAVIVAIVKGIKHAASPVQTDYGKILGKRIETNVSGGGTGMHMGSTRSTHTGSRTNTTMSGRNMHTSVGMGSHTSTFHYYYVTVEHKDKTRREYKTKKRVYGTVFENDQGIVTTKGKKLISFQPQGENPKFKSETNQFCAYCGVKMQPGDNACRDCGGRVKK